jgi:hypothetical protein
MQPLLLCMAGTLNSKAIQRLSLLRPLWLVVYTAPRHPASSRPLWLQACLALLYLLPLLRPLLLKDLVT